MANEPERAKVRIACRIPNGVMIRRHKEGYDDGTGFKPSIADGPGVKLNGPSSLHTGVGSTERSDLEPGITEVDAEWWAAWSEQYKDAPMVTSGNVFELKDENKDEPAK